MRRAPLERLSRTLSLLLRHRPETFGVTLDGAGWADVDQVLRGLRRRGADVDLAKLEEVVRDNDKGRFELDRTRSRIRAVHGHSVAVDLGLIAEEPPEELYHGTVDRFLDAILREGLRPRGRRHVHLSETIDDATEVGARRGRPVILRVASRRMHEEGHRFHRSSSGVWLTNRVPPTHLVVEPFRS